MPAPFDPTVSIPPAVGGLTDPGEKIADLTGLLAKPDPRAAELARRRFGIDRLHPLQEQALEAVLAGRDTLVFGRWTRNCRVVPNRYGILEPSGTEEIPIPQFDVALLPLVGWDRRGIRLGMCASYYDRAFQPFAQSPRPMRMGVAYEAQEHAGLPRDPWDIFLHAMLTEKGWFTCER